MNEDLKKCEEEVNAVLTKYNALLRINHVIQVVSNPVTPEQKVSEIITDISK